MTKLDDLISGREGLEHLLQAHERFEGHPDVDRIAERLRSQIQALRWAERVCRAAIVIEEERTPDGVSETIVDELCKAVRG